MKTLFLGMNLKMLVHLLAARVVEISKHLFQ